MTHSKPPWTITHNKKWGFFRIFEEMHVKIHCVYTDDEALANYRIVKVAPEMYELLRRLQLVVKNKSMLAEIESLVNRAGDGWDGRG